MRTTLLTGGHVYSPAAPDATALAVTGATVAWVGEDAAGRARYPDAVPVDLAGALVTPAFVDAHVHATASGLLHEGLDLTTVRSLPACLDRIRAAAATAPPGGVLWGHGWDETTWPQRRAPTRAELDAAAGDVAVYASRIDVHSALTSSALLARAEGAVAGCDGWSAEGPLTRAAHHQVRRLALAALSTAQRDRAQRAFLRHAAARGVAAVHECSGPDIADADDLSALLALGSNTTMPDVVGYWGERGVPLPEGAAGLAGDLFVDGALGSATAALHAPYLDPAGSTGARYLDADQVAAHVAACTAAGRQAGFHVIGDAAVATVVDGFAAAAHRAPGLAGCRHRLEHLEMVTAAQASRLAAWGVVASVQPLFDAAWGGTDRMYAQRLGADRAAGLNPFAALAEAGMVLAFGSDSPVTPVDPWATVRAAVHHRTPGSGIAPAAAFAAHTRGGWYAAGDTDPHTGTLVPGAPATYAVWAAGERENGLPALHPDAESPRCLATVLRGVPIFREDQR